MCCGDILFLCLFSRPHHKYTQGMKRKRGRERGRKERLMCFADARRRKEWGNKCSCSKVNWFVSSCRHFYGQHFETLAIHKNPNALSVALCPHLGPLHSFYEWIYHRLRFFFSIVFHFPIFLHFDIEKKWFSVRTFGFVCRKAYRSSLYPKPTYPDCDLRHSSVVVHVNYSL